MIKKKCITCGTLNDMDCTAGCVVCETEQEWLYTCDKHQDVVFLTKRKKCPICALKQQVEKSRKTTIIKPSAKKESKSKATQKIKRPFSWEKNLPLTKRQLKYLVDLGMDKSSVKKLSKLEAAEKISKLLARNKK